MNDYTKFLSFNNCNFTEELNFIGPIDPALHLCNGQLKSYLIDRGAEFERHFPLHLRVGDGDSTNHPMDIKFPADKDFSDLKGALQLIQGNSSLKIHFYGFLGGRKDHELINIGEIFHFLKVKTQTQCLLYDQKGVSLVGLTAGTWELSGTGLVSFLTLVPTHLEISGSVKYPFANSVNTLTSIPLSNYANGEFKVSFDQPTYIYFQNK
jgi:thiamine pyrophosphokinase